MIAKIYRVTKPVEMWQVVYTDHSAGAGHSKRVRKHFTELADAEAYAADLNKRISMVGTSGLSLNAQSRADFFAAREVLDAAGVSFSLVEIARRYVHDSGAGVVAKRDAFKALADFLLAKKAENLSERARQNLDSRVGAWLTREAIVHVAEINRTHAEALLMRKGVGPATRRNDMNAASSFCGWLERKGWLVENPLRKVARPKVVRSRPAIWWADEAAKILNETVRQSADSVPGLVLLLFAGVRPSELAHCRVELAAKCVRVEGGKTRGRANRTIALSPNACAWLRKYPQKKYEVHRYWRSRIVKKAGVKWGQDTPRHTFISMRLAVKPDEGAVAREAGNSPDIIFRHYHRLVDAKAARAFWAIKPLSASPVSDSPAPPSPPGGGSLPRSGVPTRRRVPARAGSAAGL